MVLQEEKGSGHVVLRERSRGPLEGVTWYFRRKRGGVTWSSGRGHLVLQKGGEGVT